MWIAEVLVMSNAMVHIENRRLADAAVGRIRLADLEHEHLHTCRVCQGVLYLFVRQLVNDKFPSDPLKPPEAA